mmetsp:Transcript_36172/g.86986  ORF Transcript_36172/g.86986 Transcript_36172/m.86986 type:complete len:2449 (-) Transcript_36172:61-7407(-)
MDNNQNPPPAPSGGGSSSSGGMDSSSFSIPRKSSSTTAATPTATSSTLNNDTRPSPSSSASSSSLMGTIPRKAGFGSIGNGGSGSNHKASSPSASSAATAASVAVEPTIPRKRPSQLQDLSAPSTVPAVSANAGTNKTTISLKKLKLKRRSAASSSSSPPSSSPSSLPPNVISVTPFVVRVSLKGVAWRGGSGITSQTSTRTAKRDRPVYQELADTDDDMDLLDSEDGDDHHMEEEEEVIYKKPSSSSKNKSNKKLKKGRSSPAGTARIPVPTDTLKQTLLSSLAAGPSVSNMNTCPAKDLLMLGNENIESPPPGALSSLWYSREVFLNTFVLEKILGWKTRPVTRLEWDPTTTAHTPTTSPQLDSTETLNLSAMALGNPLIAEDPAKRMEVSRLNHEECPIVLTLACQAQNNNDNIVLFDPLVHRQPSNGNLVNGTPTKDVTASEGEGQNASIPISHPSSNGNGNVNSSHSNGESVVENGNLPSSNEPIQSQNDLTSRKPRFRLKDAKGEREEVYLVKWRGKSHLHVSWEREADLIRFDQSNNYVASSKIKRFIQSQELSFGLDWKQVLEAERSTSANIHAHGGQPHEEDLSEGMEEEYYPPASTEIERVLGCDETEMSIDLFAKQRALNILTEQDRVERKEKGQVVRWNSSDGLKEILTEQPWDPEDNVRYVVKWKGLPFAEMTWEYWRDIKKDAVNEAEDFWFRQKPFDESTRDSLPHPDVRHFKKIQESPLYGISHRERPIADSVNGRIVPKEDEEEGPADQGLRLRGYQLEGVNWLLFNWWNKRSCILADEMGLGKTIQTVGFLKLLQDLPDTRVRGPFLIIAPLSLVGQWQSELATWAPDLNVVLYHGSADARSFLVKQEFFLTDQFVPKATATKFRKKNLTKFHVLISTYEVVLKDIDVFKHVQWKALIVDEAHRLKNPKAKLFEELINVPRDHCVLLTGTPLANATEELWALLHFCNKKIFPSKDGFLEKFGQLTDASQVAELHSVLKPYLLRRVKDDVEKSLPPKEETIFEVSLTPTQKKYYKAIFERNTMFLFKGTKPSNAPSLMNVMMELRKCCNHPYLVRGVEERILAEAAEQAKDPTTIDYRKLFGEQLIKSSGKMVLINKLLPKLFSGGHKVLIFSQMVRVLDLLEELLKLMKYKYERLDGSTSSSSRAAAVDRFKKPSCQRFVMLLSTRAGGLGLNLTAADTVIIFDSDWNPQNDLQAIARSHRIGQTRAVRVYRLLTAKTYEMHMFHSASMKLGLERAVLSNREQGEGSTDKKRKSKQEREAQAKEIDQLLKKGAYDVFRDDDDEEARKFMETDIDQLMESSAKKVTYGKTETTLSSGLGSFSKASFVADTADGEKDVDLDDPDFWSKAVGLEKPEETPEEVLLMVDDGVKRSRKQVEQFDPYKDERQAEERKQNIIAQKLLAEKEEKERLKEERRKKKEAKLLEKERKRKEKEEARAAKALEKKRQRENETKNPAGDITSPPKKKTKVAPDGSLIPKLKKKKVAMSKELVEVLAKNPRLRKQKRAADRKRSQRRVENSFPPVERLRQAWDVPHRNRVAAAFLRFGFGRFIKIRSDSSLHSLPIQDIEVFVRSYTFQLGVQSAVSFMAIMEEKRNPVIRDENMPEFLAECIGQHKTTEFEWLSDVLRKGMQYFLRVEDHLRSVRMPLVIAEPTFVASLRRGPALRSLRRLSLIVRLERVIKGCLDSIVAELGPEQLGQRGCVSDSFPLMDIDLTARLVTAEELKLAVGLLLRNVSHVAPAAWWDRSCDIGLLIGSFVHGLGNYEAMMHDNSLPFVKKLENYAKSDPLATDAQANFLKVTKTAAKVCDDAFDNSKFKAQREIQKAVAAAAAAKEKIEEDAAALRTGGIVAGAINNRMSEPRVDNLYEIIDGQDEHFITLPRLRESIGSAIRPSIKVITAESKGGAENAADGNEDEATPAEEDRRRKRRLNLPLPFPDSRVLNYRISLLLSEIERSGFRLPSGGIWPRTEEVSESVRLRSNGLKWVLNSSTGVLTNHVAEYSGIGVNASQCEVTHRTMDDKNDYSMSAASTDLTTIARGPDSHRYLRALGVPMSLGRLGLSTLLHADKSCLNQLLENERSTYYGHDKKRSAESGNGDEKNPNPMPKEETAAADRSDPTTSVSQNPRTGNLFEHIPSIFRENHALRAAVCVTVLYHGYPVLDQTDASISTDITKLLVQKEEQPSSLPLLQRTQFRASLQELYSNDIEMPSTEAIVHYIQSCLLPHCLKLSLYGNGTTTWDARGSKGEFETASGISRYQEPCDMLQSPLPDPCLPLQGQSLEAIGTAAAVIRRVRLLRCSQAIAVGKVIPSTLSKVLHSKKIRQSLCGLPIWWCPWIHDLALLLHASSRGVFAILRDRSTPNAGSVFSQEAILQHIKSTFPGVTDEWAKTASSQFPTMNVIERRLAFVCALATQELDGDDRFDNIPMFDHGGWPRN